MGFLQPGLLGLMTRRVGPQNQGQLQGANQSLQGISSIIGPPLFGLTFAWSIRHQASLHLPGLAILTAAALLALAFLLSLRVARPVQAAPVPGRVRRRLGAMIAPNFADTRGDDFPDSPCRTSAP